MWENQVFTGTLLTSLIVGALFQAKTIGKFIFERIIRRFTNYHNFKLLINNGNYYYSNKSSNIGAVPITQELIEIILKRYNKYSVSKRTFIENEKLNDTLDSDLIFIRNKWWQIPLTISVWVQQVPNTSFDSIEILFISYFNKKRMMEEVESIKKELEENIERRKLEYLYFNDKRIQRIPNYSDKLVLDESVKQNIFGDLELFFNQKEFYQDRNIPYTRGYLLHGAPGCGKTSIIKSIAHKYGLDIYTVDLNKNSFFAGNFNTTNGLLVIEDIDSYYKGREVLDPEVITFSTLLNAIDGINEGDGRILIITTNNPENIDPALIRPGRCDVICELKNPNKEKVEEYLKLFFNEDVVLDSYSHSYSYATLQNLCLIHKHNKTFLINHLCGH